MKPEHAETVDFREGDIFRWRWKNDVRHADNAPYRSYHCRSQIAVVRNGKLFDTFWGSPSYEHIISPDDVLLERQGNPEEMTKIHPADSHYYRREDLVDMRHSNNSRAPVYVKAGASRDPEVMAALVDYEIERRHSAIRSAQWDLERLADAKESIAAGKLDNLYIPRQP